MFLFEIICVLLITFLLYSLIFYGFVIAAVLLERKKTAVNAFYTIYVVKSLLLFFKFEPSSNNAFQMFQFVADWLFLRYTLTHKWCCIILHADWLSSSLQFNSCLQCKHESIYSRLEFTFSDFTNCYVGRTPLTNGYRLANSSEQSYSHSLSYQTCNSEFMTNLKISNWKKDLDLD